MYQSRILGTLEMTHSSYVEDQQMDKDNQTNNQQEQIYKTLVSNAKKSYVANKKKGKKQQIKTQDVKPHRKNKIFHQKSQGMLADLSLSKLPNYNVMNVQNISQNNVKCWSCNAFQNNSQCTFVVQDPCRLIIFKKGTAHILYSFNFDTVQVQVRGQFQVSKTNQFLIIVRPLILKVTHESSNILRSWCKNLHKIANQSQGKKLQMRDIIERDQANFYKTLFCTQDQFTSNCETGDILLFQDQHFFAKAQRFILNADYDHVAMIIRDKKYGILMFEANSMSGVSLTPWNCMIKYGWFKYIRRIVWRKLENVQRTKFFQDVIHKFVRQNLKTKYFISFDKLLSNKSYIGKTQQEQGFFCSQLVAKIYKDLEILTRDTSTSHHIPSNNIYPYHFSQKYNLKLQMGNLSKQYEIHFNEEMLKKQYGQGFIQL